ncbi:hypothetical protein [Spiroplasma endosymbiont of Polydrusus cervinus]|uniref:hypothetical protein n=1 Tax=Spiroplasma endosymbiont of Polydrusus cervinus TaxID=3066287 RepID=UPI0030D511E1
MKNIILEKHFSNICDQLRLVLNTEKIHDSTNPIQLLYDNVILIHNNGRVIDYWWRFHISVGISFSWYL